MPFIYHTLFHPVHISMTNFFTIDFSTIFPSKINLPTGTLYVFLTSLIQAELSAHVNSNIYKIRKGYKVLSSSICHFNSWEQIFSWAIKLLFSQRRLLSILRMEDGSQTGKIITLMAIFGIQNMNRILSEINLKYISVTFFLSQVGLLELFRRIHYQSCFVATTAFCVYFYVPVRQ
jgi:hypothetical protein